LSKDRKKTREKASLSTGKRALCRTSIAGGGGEGGRYIPVARKGGKKLTTEREE